MAYVDFFSGEVVELSKTGIKSVYIAPRPNNKPPATSIFEYVYFARPDSIMEGGKSSVKITCILKTNQTSEVLHFTFNTNLLENEQCSTDIELWVTFVFCI